MKRSALGKGIAALIPEGISCTDSGSWSRRRAFATVERSFPTCAAIASCARPSSARRWW